MGRVLLAAALIAAASGVAAAGSTRKVSIETEPQGAKVYLNSLDDGPVCQATPCTIDAPLGATPIILRLDKYDPIIDTLEVKRSRDRKPIVVKFKLTSSVGTIVVEAAAAKGASVRVDEEDKGKAPVRIETDAGAHHIVVVLAGKTLYDAYENVDTGQELEVPIKATTVAVKDPPDDDDGGDSGGDHGGDKGGDDGKVTRVEVRMPHHGAPRRRFIAAGAVVEVGFRHFEYVAPKNGLPPFEDEGGQTLVGPAVELWPAELVGAHRLRGLSVFAKVEFGVNHQDVLYTGGTMPGAQAGPTTFWGGLEASVRQRWTIGDVLGLEASGGFTRDQMQFNASKTSDLLKVPVVDYHSIRIGVRAALAGAYEPYIAGETRIVLSGGDLANRFDHHDVSGFRAALGLGTHLGPFAVRAEFSYLKYTWGFSYDGINDVAEAQGATDTVRMLSFNAGYQY